MTSVHSYNPFAGYESKQVEIDKEKANATPTGTVSEILDWVGEDKERAQRALDAEKENKKPRSSLVKDLEGIVK